MRKLRYIPGFRSGNIIFSIIAIMYYSGGMLSLLATLGDGIEYIMMSITMLSIPFAVFGTVDLLVGRYKDDFKKEFILCMIPISIIVVHFSFISKIESENSFSYKASYLESNIIDYESKIDEEKEAKEYIKSGALVDQISDEELVSIKNENKALRTTIDEYKEELKSQTYVADSTSDNSTSGYNSSSSNNTSDYSSSSNNNSYDSSYNSNSNSSSGSSYGSSNDNENSGKHIGKGVYIANGNRYYHAISNCKYLEGAPTSYVTLTSSMNKYECNCWTNPIAYKPSSSSSSSNNNSGGRTVYVAKGNSYYHASKSCKYISGASISAVSINNVGGKPPCNCVKYY